MGKRDESTRIQLDWYNVRYRTIVLWGVVFVGALAAGGFYFYYNYYLRSSPQGQARSAIRQAETLLEEASSQAESDRLKALREDAQRFLDSARANYNEANYNDARVSAIRSQNFSQKLIDIVRGEDSTSKEVRFYKIEGDAKVKRAGQFIWESADPKMTLSVGDQVKTASDAMVQLIYFDGTITTIKPGSLLEIKELYEHPTTKVRKVREKLNFGGVSATLAGGNVAGSFHEVSTETTTARSQDRSEIEVGYDQDRRQTEVRVHSGKAEVASGGKEIQVNPAEMVAVGQDQRVLQRTRIPKAPDLQQPMDQKVFVYDDTDSATTLLSWGGVPEAARYHLQISRRSLLGELLLDKDDVRSNSVKLPRLKVGSYYWRVASINSEKVESAFSETRKFKIISTEIRDREDRIPPRVEIKDFLVFSYQVIINGKTEPGALVSIDGQRVDVYDDGTFTAVIKLKHDGKNVLRIVAQDISGNETQLQRTAYVEAF